MEKSKVKSLDEIIEIQDKGVISKTILAKKSGTITLFAFDTGEGLSEHSAPYDAFILVLKGQIKITILDKGHILDSGDAIVMPANEPHSLQALETVKLMLVMIKSD